MAQHFVSHTFECLFKKKKKEHFSSLTVGYSLNKHILSLYLRSKPGHRCTGTTFPKHSESNTVTL